MRRGFTLMEILIVVAVLGMLIVLVQQGMAFGLRANAVQVRMNERKADLDAVDRSLRDLIRRADPGQFPEPATLQGGPATVSMVTTLPTPSGRAPAEVTLLESDGRLLLRWTPRRHVERFVPPPAVQTLVVLSGIEAFRLSYFDGAAWHDDWHADRLPRLVRLQLAFSDGARHWPPIIVSPVREAVEQ